MDTGSTMSSQDSCYGGASVAGAVIGTFLTTILLLAVAALVYRQWRRHKGKHLVLVTNPEIVEDAYAFDNPCFKDATPAVNRNHETRPVSTANLVVETTPTTKDSARWSSPWSSLGLSSVNKNERRRTLDDSCLGTKATRVSVVSLRSRDFTGLGFNVCGNMREGIFVKDLLHRGPASESGRIHPGDRIGSVKISFRSMVYEDALTILSYASPYDVELEVETGGSGAGSRPTTLLKKTVGPSPSRICHPLYRSQSIPELSQSSKTSAKRLFIADPNDSLNSNYSTMNSTIKSSKSTPGSHTLERHHEENKAHNHHHHQIQQQNHHHHHHKFGIKVLPALDGTVHRIENQNEHNTNLERRNSRKLDIDNDTSDDLASRSNRNNDAAKKTIEDELRNTITERYQKRENSRQAEGAVKLIPNNSTAPEHPVYPKSMTNGHDVPDVSSGGMVTRETMETINIPSEVPAEVHNAAMAARRNRKNSMELLNATKSVVNDDNPESNDLKSPQKNKRKAPAPPTLPPDGKIEMAAGSPGRNNDVPSRRNNDNNPDDSIESITDYAESLNDYVGKLRDGTADNDPTDVRRQILEENASKRRKSVTDSDNDSEVHDSFTTIELKPADITIHHTPVPAPEGRTNGKDNHGEDDDEEEDDDVYRKAASLGDLSKYENKSCATLERAQSLDMADTGSKKRKLVTPDDINESTEDLTKIEDMDTFDRRKLKKSDKWGTLESAIWNKPESEITEVKTRMRKRSNGNSERSRSAIEVKLKGEDGENATEDSSGRLVPIEMPDDTSIELYNLPLSIRLSGDFIRTERMFNPDEDNSLARIVNNGRIVKSPTPEEMELDFRRATPETVRDWDRSDEEEIIEKRRMEAIDAPKSPEEDDFGAALRYFDQEIRRSSSNEKKKPNLVSIDLTKDETPSETQEDGNLEGDSLYAGKIAIQEEPMRKVTIKTGCPSCDDKFSHHGHSCRRGTKNTADNRDWQPQEVSTLPESPTDEKSGSLSAFKIGLTRFERMSPDARMKSASPTESRIEKKLLRERGVEIDEDDDGTRGGGRTKEEMNEDEEEGYDFGSGITVNSKNASSPIADHRNVSNVSVSSGENSEDSGLVRESRDYTRQDSDPRPPLPETPMPSSASPQKLTYITEINVSASRDNLLEAPREAAEVSSRRDNVKPPRNEASLTSNGKTTAVKKPPVPPRRSDAAKTHSRDTEPSEKQVVYVSEYKTTAGKDKNENNEKSLAVNKTDAGRPSGKKKIENWIYLGDNKEQNPWGNGSSQQQTVTNIVVSAGEETVKQSQ